MLEVCISTTSQTMPDVFQKHKTYTLPVEDHQIRRGGNGQMFTADYFGYSLVAKKTLFRTREYNIITRLNHSNIVPLLALMVGEVSHRKRFFCYHMLPRMSGIYMYSTLEHSLCIYMYIRCSCAYMVNLEMCLLKYSWSCAECMVFTYTGLSIEIYMYIICGC